MSGAQNGLPEDMNDMSLEEFIGELEQNEEIAEGKRHTGDDFYRMYLEEMKEIAPFAEGEQERLLALLSTGSSDEAKRAVKRLTEGKLGDTLRIAKEYEMAGAAAISCLTEPYYFHGKDLYLKEITQHVKIPVLRKDFTVDPYMIYQARTLGASAILLICSLLSQSELEEYQAIATELGMSALVEAHDDQEVEMALRAEASIIGVNNRDLKTFTVDINNSTRYRKMVPKEVAFVSESGIKTAEDIAKLLENGTDAVLIGETLMRSENKKQALDELRGI